MKGLARIQKKQLSAQAINQLMEWLSSGEIPVGSRIPPEPEMMERLGVGRSTIREAVKVLEHMGFLDVRVGSGTYLAEVPSHVEPFLSRLRRAELAEVRTFKLGLESQIAYLAARNRSDEDIGEIENALNRCEAALDAADLEQFAAADFDFHTAIAGAADSALLYDFYVGVRKIVNEMELRVDLDEFIREDIRNFHRSLFQAIADGDEQLAITIWFQFPRA